MRRRTFLVGGLLAAGAGAGLLVGVGRIADRVGVPGAPGSGTVPLNGWVSVGSDGWVTVTMAHVEMGQGVSTALPMLVAEELDVPLSMVRTVPAAQALLYGNRTVFGATWWFHPDNEHGWFARTMIALGEANGAFLGVQLTGGSSSVRDAYEPLRVAGASARAMLVAAAAGRWNVSALECTTADGAVFHRSGKRLGYGALAAEAATLPVPGDVAPKVARLRRLVGTSAPRVDVEAKVTGAAVYGADVRLPGMLFAAVRGCPVPGATIGHLNSAAAQALPGVVRVVTYEGAAGCAAG